MWKYWKVIKHEQDEELASSFSLWSNLLLSRLHTQSQQRYLKSIKMKSSSFRLSFHRALKKLKLKINLEKLRYINRIEIVDSGRWANEGFWAHLDYKYIQVCPAQFAPFIDFPLDIRQADENQEKNKVINPHPFSFCFKFQSCCHRRLRLLLTSVRPIRSTYSNAAATRVAS